MDIQKVILINTLDCIAQGTKVNAEQNYSFTGLCILGRLKEEESDLLFYQEEMQLLLRV